MFLYIDSFLPQVHILLNQFEINGSIILGMRSCCVSFKLVVLPSKLRKDRLALELSLGVLSQNFKN